MRCIQPTQFDKQRQDVITIVKALHREFVPVTIIVCQAIREIRNRAGEPLKQVRIHGLYQILRRGRCEFGGKP